MTTPRKRRVRRPALLVRFPSLRAPRTSWPAIAPETAADYPELADDITTVDRVVGPAFREADLAALGHQNRYRRQQVVIILGSALLTGLGGLQAVVPEQRWPGLVLGLLGALLAVLSTAVNELNALEGFMTERVKAERLRSACFRFLSRTGRFADANRVGVLRRVVNSIRAGEEPQ